MIKNNKGVTLISLVVTILILGILVGVSIAAGEETINQVKIGRIVSNMTLIQAKAEPIYEEYQFYNNDTNYLVKADDTVYTLATMGVRISEAEIAIIAQEAGVASSDVSNWNWYKWDANTLKAQGLDKKILGNDECFFVNYEYGEIVFSSGTSYDGSAEYYSMSGLNHILENI